MTTPSSVGPPLVGRALRDALPPADRPVAHWHVAPLVDALGYHWSWVPALLVLLAAGDAFPKDYWPAYVAVLALNFAHQALTLRFVQADADVRRTERRRLAVLPLAMLLLFGIELLSGKTWVTRLTLAPRDLGIVPAAVLLLVQLDTALRDDRPLPARALLGLALPTLVAPAAYALIVGRQGAVPAGTALLVGAAAFAVGLALASASLRAPGEAVARRVRLVEVGVPVALAGLALAAVAWPAFATGLYPPKKTRVADLLGPVAVVSYAWNFWHVYMQKYGILRLYAAKSGATGDRRVPGWVDRLFVFAWIPLTFALLGPARSAFLTKRYGDARSLTVPLFAFLAEHATVLVATGSLVVAVATGLFLAAEWRASGLRNAPRLSAASAFFLLSAALCVLDPIKVVIAFGFNHTIEYAVFVWAWQRRKLATTPPDPASALRPVAIGVAGFVVPAALAWAAIHSWDRYVLVGTHQPRLLGRSPSDVLVALATYLSITHFYVDGFLWKMRKPAVRALI